MPQVVAIVGNFFSWVGGAFGAGGAAGAGTGAAAGAVGTGVTTAALIAPNAAAALATGSIWTTIGSAALNMAISSAISIAFKPDVASTSGAPLDFKADPESPVPFVIGRTATGGSTIYAEVFGGDKARFLRFVVVLSAGGPIEGVEAPFRANEQDVTFVSRNAVGYYNNKMYMDYKLGDQPETAHDVSISPWGSTPSGVFDSDHKLSGIATAQWIMRYTQNEYSTGVPTPRWVLSGPAVYDPREDSTYPGGSGTQRHDDPDTWEFTGNDNPYLQALTWCLGHQSNGLVVLGAGIPWEGIDVAAFVEGANVAEANGWTCGGVAYSSENKWAILETMLRAGGGKPMRLGAKVSCVVSTPRVSIATLTSADIDGTLEINGAPGRRDRFNTARYRYRDEDFDWEFIQADPISISAAVAEDGENRTKEIDFGLVQDKDQGAQLAAYDILDSREIGPIKFPATPKWMALKPGDCITLDDDIFGASRKLVIWNRDRDIGTGQRTLSCMGETDSKHATALGMSGTVPALPTYDPIDDTVILPPDVSAYTVTGLAVQP
jgi:hypothetical protein